MHGFVGLRSGQVKLFGDIVNDIEELGRLDFSFLIDRSQQLPFPGSNRSLALPRARENQAIDRALH